MAASLQIQPIEGGDGTIDMEAVRVGHLQILLVRQILDQLVDELNFFLAFLFLEIVILHLMENEKDSIEVDVMEVIQERGRS